MRVCVSCGATCLSNFDLAAHIKTRYVHGQAENWHAAEQVREQQGRTRELRVHLILARQIRLPPAAVRPLPPHEKRGDPPLRVARVHRQPQRAQRLCAEPAAVREAHRPAAVPRAVRPLRALHPRPATAQRGGDLALAVARHTRAERRQRCDACGRALDVGVVDHDVAEGLGRVEELDRGEGPLQLVRRPAAVGVLVGEDDVDGGTEGGLREGLADGGRRERCKRQRRLEALKQVTNESFETSRARDITW